MLTGPYHLEPLAPYFIIIKLGFTGVYTIFRIVPRLFEEKRLDIVFGISYLRPPKEVGTLYQKLNLVIFQAFLLSQRMDSGNLVSATLPAALCGIF